MDTFRRLLVISLPAVLTACASATSDRAAGFRSQLAPTGTLRVGVNIGSPLSLVRSTPAAEPRGVAHDLGRELARRLGVPVEFVEFRNINDVLAAMKAGRVDLTGTNATPARAVDVDFTAPAIAIEVGYLVPPGSVLQDAEDVKRPGLRVAVTQGSTSQTTLPRILPQAVIVPAANLAAAGQMLRDRTVDAYSTNKAILFELSDSLPGSRVLAGSVGVELWALAIPKGRDAALPSLNDFVNAVRHNGALADAVQRSGLRGSRIP